MKTIKHQIKYVKSKKQFVSDLTVKVTFSSKEIVDILNGNAFVDEIQDKLGFQLDGCDGYRPTKCEYDPKSKTFFSIIKFKNRLDIKRDLDDMVDNAYSCLCENDVQNGLEDPEYDVKDFRKALAALSDKVQEHLQKLGVEWFKEQPWGTAEDNPVEKFLDDLAFDCVKYLKKRKK